MRTATRKMKRKTKDKDVAEKRLMKKQRREESLWEKVKEQEIVKQVRKAVNTTKYILNKMQEISEK
jgi:hypothetical protein